MAIINVKDLDYNAVGNGIVDDTIAIQSAINDITNGDILLVPDGIYKISAQLNMNGDLNWDMKADGAIFNFTATSGRCLSIISVSGNLISKKSIEGLTLWGTNKNTDAPLIASYNTGNAIGIFMSGCHRTTLKDININGFDHAGLYIDNCYRCFVYGLWTQYNGYGVKCRTANATNFYGLEALYNLYGAENIQSIIGGVIEGSLRSGLRYTEVGARYAIHDVYFEQNCRSALHTIAAASGEADIWANSVPDFSNPSVSANWQPILLSIGGRTTFHTSMDDRIAKSHIIAGAMHLYIDGANRFFYPSKWYSFHLHPWGSIVDCSNGNSMDSVHPSGFDATPGAYYRPLGSGELNLISRNASTVPLTIQGVAGQSVNLTQWRNSNGNILASVSSAGIFTIPSGFAVSTSGSQILYNKVINGNYNTFANIGNSSLGTGIDAVKIADGSISNTEYQYLNNASGNLQQQINDHLINLSPHIAVGSGFVVSTSGSQIFYNKVIQPTYNTIPLIETISFGIDGGGSVFSSGSKAYREVHYPSTITGWTILSNISGSCTIDVRKGTYTQYPYFSSIAGTEKPVLNNQIKNQDNALTSWTTSINSGDILEFVIDGEPSGITRTQLFLKMQRS